MTLCRCTFRIFLRSPRTSPDCRPYPSRCDKRRATRGKELAKQPLCRKSHYQCRFLWVFSSSAAAGARRIFCKWGIGTNVRWHQLITNEETNLRMPIRLLVINSLFVSGCGGGICTPDFQVMGLARYYFSTPRKKVYTMMKCRASPRTASPYSALAAKENQPFDSCAAQKNT